MSGTRWFFAFLVGFGLLSFWVTSLREDPPPFSPVQTEQAQEDEIPLQVTDYTVLRDWKPNKDYLGLGLEILVGEEATEEELVALMKNLERGREHVNIRVYNSQEAYRQEQRQTYGDAYKRGYLLFYIKNLSGRGPFDGLNEIRWMQEKGHLPHGRGEKTQF